MQAPLLVIVSGAPATGKTALARQLADDVRLPLIAKDDIKESLFETLGWSDRAWSRKLGGATFALLYYFVEVELRAGRSLVVECNFLAEFSVPRFLDLRRTYGFEPFQIFCHAEQEVLVERFRRRYHSGQRHPGHVDEVLLAEPETLDQSRYAPLPIGGDVITVDTSDFALVDYAGILARLRSAIGVELPAS
jgi:predicted kinase